MHRIKIIILYYYLVHYCLRHDLEYRHCENILEIQMRFKAYRKNISILEKTILDFMKLIQ